MWLATRGRRVNRKRVQCLMRLLGRRRSPTARIRASRQRRTRSYRYLLRGAGDRGVNQVWCSDITYIPMAFSYLVVIMDGVSRAVLAVTSIKLDADFCVEALAQA